jgi:hypothetical protein
MKQYVIKSWPVIAAAALVVPAIASAAGILDTIVVVNRILGAVVPLLITVALIVFTEDKQKGIQIMLWGIVALFVMSSVWGLVALLQNTFSVQRNEPFVPRAPDISVYGR